MVAGALGEPCCSHKTRGAPDTCVLEICTPLGEQTEMQQDNHGHFEVHKTPVFRVWPNPALVSLIFSVFPGEDISRVDRHEGWGKCSVLAMPAMENYNTQLAFHTHQPCRTKPAGDSSSYFYFPTKTFLFIKHLQADQQEKDPLQWCDCNF